MNYEIAIVKRIRSFLKLVLTSMNTKFYFYFSFSAIIYVSLSDAYQKSVIELKGDLWNSVPVITSYKSHHILTFKKENICL